MLASCSLNIIKYQHLVVLFKTQKTVQSEDRGEIIYDGGVGLELIPTRIVYLCK